MRNKTCASMRGRLPIRIGPSPAGFKAANLVPGGCNTSQAGLIGKDKTSDSQVIRANKRLDNLASLYITLSHVVSV